MSTPTASVALAFGFAFFLNNVTGASAPHLLGYLIKADTKKAYHHGIICVLCLATLGAVLSFVLMILDRKKGGLLWYPENEEKVRKLKEEIDQRTENRLKEEQYKSCKLIF